MNDDCKIAAAAFIILFDFDTLNKKKMKEESEEK
jgi:hypothetical protein